MKLKRLVETLSVCRFGSDKNIPKWALGGRFFSITKTSAELSIVCETSLVPLEVKAEHDWTAFLVVGTLDFKMTGILASIANPLAQARISIFAVSTFDTDYVLIKNSAWEQAEQALGAAGFIFI